MLLLISVNDKYEINLVGRRTVFSPIQFRELIIGTVNRPIDQSVDASIDWFRSN